MICSANRGHFSKKFHLLNCEEYVCQYMWLTEAERRSKSSVNMREIETQSRTDGCSLWFFLRSTKTTASKEYRRISYPAGIVFETKFSNWLYFALSPLWRQTQRRATSAHTQLALFPCTLSRARSPKRYGLSRFPGSIAAVPLFKPSLRPQLLLYLHRGAVEGCIKSRRAVLVDTHLSKRRNSAGVVGGVLLLLLLCSVIISGWG